jgi:hypothetical protein
MSRRVPFVVLCAALVACEDEAERWPPALWCEGLCEAVGTCGGDGGPVCVSDCVGDRPSLINFSVRGAELLKPCLAGVSCADLDDPEEPWRAACFNRAAAAIEPYDYAKTFCTEFTSQFFACGGFYSAELCDREYSMFTETHVERVAACIDPSCESFLSCLDEVFE